MTINWQNGQWPGRDAQSFTAPGIGAGEVRCNPSTQWINFTPYDQQASTSMWGVLMQDPSSRGGSGPSDVSVQWARKGYLEPPPFTGPSYYLPMNRSSTGVDQTSVGSYIGLIETAGNYYATPTSGQRSTSFQLSWHWNFTDPNAARCYVAASFITARAG